MTELNESAVTHGGRLPGLYIYDVVICNDKEYAVITIQHKGKNVRFVIDNCNSASVLTKPWHMSSGKYIATHYTLPCGRLKEMYLHNFIKDNCINDGHDKIVVHINENMLDNRLENLRLVDRSEYTPVRHARRRTRTLPPDCGVVVEDIPKYISYVKASGGHGDRFIIEIPRLDVCIKLSSSKNKPLKDKFEEAKQTLQDIYEAHPTVNPHVDDMLKIELNASLKYILDQTNHDSNITLIQ